MKKINNMKNQIAVVSHNGKNYFLIESARKMKFLVPFIRMKYFTSQDTYKACGIEAYRSKIIILYGFVDIHTDEECPTAMFDHSDVHPICTEREFYVLSAEPFQIGDSLYSAIPGGELIANELHFAIDVYLAAKKSFNAAEKEMPKTKMHVESQFRYKKIGSHQILIPGLY